MKAVSTIEGRITFTSSCNSSRSASCSPQRPRISPKNIQNEITNGTKPTTQCANLNGVKSIDALNGAERVGRVGGEAGDVVPLGGVEAARVGRGGAEAERPGGDGPAAPLAGGAARLGVLDGDSRRRLRRGRHGEPGDASSGSGEEKAEAAGVPRNG